MAVKDVASLDHPSGGSAGSARHRSLFEEYVQKLRKHKREGEKWFKALIDSEEKKTGDRDQAIANVKERRPVGPVSYPYVTGTVRKYWLACVSLNQELAKVERVAPEEFILGWLMQRGYDDLAEFLSGYPFWPVGLDDNDNWV
jgi:hypothetical protein